MKPRVLWITLLAIVLLVLPSLACSITVNLPDRVKTTASRTLDISEDASAGEENSEVYLEMGAGTLEISGGASKLIEGSVRYNVEKWQPSVSHSGNRIEITQDTQGSIDLTGKETVNEWNLQLGKSPIDLEIQAGAYKGTIDLSGVPITNLRVSDGASQATVKFDSLNPVKMERLSYKTGASQVDLEGLGNANASEIAFEGGAGSYTLDFSGDLQQDLDVRLSSGMSNVRIEVPEDANIEVVVGGGLSNVSVSGTWNINGDHYARSGSGPKITINVDMGLGNLELRTR